MALAPGTRLGPYEILPLLGTGGMGEVYRARDTRLERTVAIKVLSQLSADPARRQRFEREAKAISSLNHPNICTLHDVGHQDGIDYLVMECLEGETLAKRLEKGPLPVDQVLKYGAQIADALDKAHRAGIVHRDLKPSNIMLTSSGAKLLDFGLAKPASALVDLATMTATKAETPPVTERGTIVGTFQYMSPEQVEGRELDGRSDIFSLGAVLYEMTTGHRAFEGKSRLSVASAILEKEPLPVTTLKPLAPAALDHAIRGCLAKDPDDRWQTARDLSHELKWIAEPSQTGTPALTGKTRHTPRERIAWGLAAILLFTALAALGFAYFSKAAPPATVVRAKIAPPGDMQFFPDGLQGPPAISPDGKLLVSTVRDTQGRTSLWLRSLNDAGEGRILPSTEGGGFPFWSPDSHSIGFVAGDKLKRIEYDGNSLQVLCDALLGRGGSWSQHGIILFTTGQEAGIYQIPASGGTPKQVTELNASRGELRHEWPTFLPDGRHFLFFVRSESQSEVSGIYAGSLDSPDYRLVARATSGPAFEAGGTIVYLRNETLVAQSFNETKLTTTGEPFTLPDRVGLFTAAYSRALFNVSPAGMLIYDPASSSGPNALAWHNRDGKPGGPLYTGFFYGPALSPDGTQAVVPILSSNGMSGDLWSFDLNRGTKTRLTSGRGLNESPVWEPDGRFIFFSSNATGQSHIYRSRSDGTATETVLETADTVEMPYSVCRDGRYLAYSRSPTKNPQPSIWILPLTGDRKPFALVQSQFWNTAPSFSPDCQWIAYSARENGQFEVYITHFPDAARRYQVSTQGGLSSRWRGDGRELYYVSPQNTIMAVDVTQKAETISLGTPRTLFQLTGRIPVMGQFDVTADGQRFLVTEPNFPSGAGLPTLVTNWEAEFKNKRASEPVR